jgi:hypothetical protein
MTPAPALRARAGYGALYVVFAAALFLLPLFAYGAWIIARGAPTFGWTDARVGGVSIVAAVDPVERHGVVVGLELRPARRRHGRKPRHGGPGQIVPEFVGRVSGRPDSVSWTAGPDRSVRRAGRELQRPDRH